jgi:hypothetical protein
MGVERLLISTDEVSSIAELYLFASFTQKFFGTIFDAMGGRFGAYCMSIESD